MKQETKEPLSPVRKAFAASVKDHKLADRVGSPLQTPPRSDIATVAHTFPLRRGKGFSSTSNGQSQWTTQLGEVEKTPPTHRHTHTHNTSEETVNHHHHTTTTTTTTTTGEIPFSRHDRKRHSRHKFLNFSNVYVEATDGEEPPFSPFVGHSSEGPPPQSQPLRPAL